MAVGCVLSIWHIHSLYAKNNKWSGFLHGRYPLKWVYVPRLQIGSEIIYKILNTSIHQIILPSRRHTLLSCVASYVHMFVLFLLVTDFNPAWFRYYYGFRKKKKKFVCQARARFIICGVHLLAGGVRCGKHGESIMVQSSSSNRCEDERTHYAGTI